MSAIVNTWRKQLKKKTAERDAVRDKRAQSQVREWRVAKRTESEGGKQQFASRECPVEGTSSYRFSSFLLFLLNEPGGGAWTAGRGKFLEGSGRVARVSMCCAQLVK